MNQQQKVTYYLRKKKSLPKLKDQPCDLPSNVVTPGCIPPNADKQLEQLRDFDLNNKFGPSQGIPRVDRWERASRLQLDPPIHVMQILQSHVNDSKFQSSIWSGHKLLN
ncbi:DNA polymerase delta subunit 4-like [Ciona intestinalis]